MKVLHVAPSIARSYGGPTQSLAGYLIAGRSAGIETSVAAPRASADDEAAIRSALGGEEPILFRSYGSGAFAASPSLLRWLQSKAARFDIVHVHGTLNSISSLAARTAIRNGVPTVIRPFGTLSRYTFSHRRALLKRAYFSAVERSNLIRATAIHFTTTSERNEASWHGVDFTKRAFVIPPPLLEVPSSEKPVDCNSFPIALFLGRLNPIKNIESIIDAWPRVMTSVPYARLMIAGDGPRTYRRALERRARDMGVASNIDFTGFVSGGAKAAAFVKARLLVLPSRHENFGIAALEAIAAGLPVVVSPEVQLAPFVEQHQAGIVSDTSPTALARAIVTVINDAETRKRISQQGREIVNASFSPYVIGERLMKMYTTCSAPPQRPRIRQPQATR